MKPTLMFCCVAVCGVACGIDAAGTSAAGVAVSSRHDEGFQNQGFQNQGFQNQGFQNQGSTMGGQPIRGFQLQSLLGTSASKADRVDLVQGELIVNRSTQAGTTSSYAACGGYTWGTSRTCGFDRAGIGTCTPYTTVTLGATTSCSTTPSCSGDPILRVCAGTSGCEAGSSTLLATGDDSCSSLCPMVTFLCPASGVYSVMTGPYATSSTSYSVTLTATSGTYPYFNSVVRGTGVSNMPLTAELEDGGTMSMVIAATLPELEAYVPPSPRPHGSTYRYNVQYSLNGNLASLCGPDDVAGGDFQPVAIPVAGVFDTTGAYLDSSRLFTLACRTGVINKCYRWGYRPWDTTGIPSYTTAKRMLGACTRMARADYCGSGESYTRYGTLINIWDRLSTPAQTRAASSGLFFEAGWRDNGAVCLSHKRWSDAPDEVFTCPTLSPNGRNGAHATCDNENDVYRYASDTALFNESAFNDAGI